VGGYLLSALLSASLVLVLLEPLLVYPLVFLIQSVEGLVSPTMAAVVPSLVPKEALVSANALRVVLSKVTASLGPALAGLLYALVGPVWLFVFDALTFAAVAYAAYGPPAALGMAPPRQHPLGRGRRGNAFCCDQPNGGDNLGALHAYLPVLAGGGDRDGAHLAGGGPDRGRGPGAFVHQPHPGGRGGGGSPGWAQKGHPQPSAGGLAQTLLALPMLLGVTFPTFPVLLAVFFLSGNLFDISGVATQLLLQAVVPRPFLGRVFSLVNVSFALGVLLVLGLVGPLSSALGAVGALQATALAVGALGAVLYLAAKRQAEEKEEPSG